MLKNVYLFPSSTETGWKQTFYWATTKMFETENYSKYDQYIACEITM